MFLNFNKEDIHYVDIVARNITINLKKPCNGCSYIELIYDTIEIAEVNLIYFIKKYNLIQIPESPIRQFIVKN